MRRAGLLVLLAVVAGCGSANTATTTATTGPTVEQTAPVTSNVRHVAVHEAEFRLDPANATGVKEGLVEVTIVNDGKIPHSLAVDGPNGLVEFDGQVDPGHSGKLQVDLDMPGTYKWFCPIDRHRGKGMQGTITVVGTSPARGSEPTPTSTSTTQTTPTVTQTQTQTQTQTHTTTSTTPTATTNTPGY